MWHTCGMYQKISLLHNKSFSSTDKLEMLSMAPRQFHTMFTPVLCLLIVEACTSLPGGKCNK
jgi:hypothetical protein